MVGFFQFMMSIFYKFVYLMSKVLQILNTYHMLKDLTEIFYKEASLDIEKIEEQPVTISIESSLCDKQATDIYANLKKIFSIMLQNKQNYFSNAAYSYEAFTDQQRNQFDQQIKNSLSITNAKISQFQEVVSNLKVKNITQKQHMKNISICLYQFYKNISQLFREFLEFNESRKQKLENTISLQAKIQFKAVHESSAQNNSEKASRRPQQMDEQLQRESKMIFMEKVSQHKKIEDTRRILEKINEVLDKMQNKVLEQEVLTSSFRQIGEVGLFHIEKGNKNLIEANAISKDSGKYWTWYFLSLAFSLLFLDFLKS